jgi:hypothetical protein
VHLVRDAAGDVVQGEVTALLGDHGMEVHLQQQVAELFAQVVRIAVVDRLEGLGRLLLEVAGQRPVRLLPLPRALPAQPSHVGTEGEERLVALGSIHPPACSATRALADL